MQYREKIYREYGIIFGEEDLETEEGSIGVTIADKYGWYIMIHKIAEEPITAALNWMSYTKEIELEQQRNNKS